VILTVAPDRRLGARGRSDATVTHGRPYQPFRCPARRPSGEPHGRV